MKEQLAQSMQAMSAGQISSNPDFPTLHQVVEAVANLSSDFEYANKSLSEIINRIGAYSHKYDPLPQETKGERPHSVNDDTALVLIGKKLRAMSRQIADYREEIDRLNNIIGG